MSLAPTHPAPMSTAVESAPLAPGAFPPTADVGSLAELLGEAAVGPRGGGFVCPCCGGRAPRVVRARPGGSSRWVAVCAICAGRLLAGHPATVVGGRISPRLRRAG